MCLKFLASKSALRAMTEIGKLWHQQCQKLVEFKRNNGHCMVPNKHEQDTSLGCWVRNQRRTNANNKMRPCQKVLLDELEFVWNFDESRESNWKTQHESLLSLNDRMAIAWCHPSTRKTSLLGCGLPLSGESMQMTFWMNMSLSGDLMKCRKAAGTSNMKSGSSSLMKKVPTVSCHTGTRKTDVFVIGLALRRDSTQ
jgi:hypothetical protein